MEPRERLATVPFAGLAPPEMTAGPHQEDVAAFNPHSGLLLGCL